MAQAKRIKEIQAVTPNKAGMLAEVAGAIADAGVNIVALSASGMGKNAKFLIVTENNQKAIAALKAKNFDVKEGEAVSVSLGNKVGAAKELAEKLAKAGIDLDYCYGSTGDGSESLLIFSTKDIEKAIGVC